MSKQRYTQPQVCITDCDLESMMALSKFEEVGDEEQLVKDEFSFRDNVWGDSFFSTDED